MEKDWKEVFASYGLWTLVEDVSDDGDGVFELTKDGKMLEEEIEEAIRMMKEEYITELFGEGIITFWGKDFDGKETLTVMFKGDVARFYYNELSKLTTK